MVDAQTVSVAVETPRHAGLEGALSYASQRPLTPGTLVRVPLGRREVAGIVWSDAAGDPATATEIREITGICDALPPLPLAWRELVAFAAGYYQRGLGEIALSVLPTELRRLDNAAIANRLRRLEQAPEAGRSGRDAGSPPHRSCRRCRRPRPRPASASPRRWRPREPGTVLLHGTTGSGKTEVYLRAAARALALGRQALVLVPEINLTPQLVARFAARFPGQQIVALHSGLTPAARLRHWLMAHAGRADIVLGTRLAVFAPLPRLGLIVVDEEHDPSYKQQEGARYSARDLAVWRGRNENVLVLLGSATPSLESWHNADAGRYRRLALPGRIGGAAWPEVRLLDMGRLPKSRGVPAALAPPLVAAIEARIARGEQSLVFLNRRGYAPVLHCGECSWKSGCPHCSAWRVFHKQDRTLRCHHCGLADAVPRACPDCGNPDIAPIGRGTERLEEQIGGAAARGADRPHRCRQHAQEGRARGPARRRPRRRGRRPGRHADDRQGPRLSPHRPGRRGQPRQLALQQRLPRAGAAVRPADAGGRPGRARRGAGVAERDVGADLASGPSALCRASPARLRGVRGQPAEGARLGRAAAVFAPRRPSRRGEDGGGGARLSRRRRRSRPGAPGRARR